MLVFIGQRLVQLVPVLLGVLVLTFALTRFTPGDPAEIMAGPEAGPEAIQAIRERLGLDRPLAVQFARYVVDLFQGDLGISYTSGRDVSELLGRAVFRTAQLAAVAIVATVLVGVPLGVIAAVYKDSVFDAMARLASLFGVSIPIFVFGLLLIYVFAYQLGWFPTYGAGTWRNLILPGITLGTWTTALVARLSRASMLDTLGQDFIRTARSKGVGKTAVIFKHALRNAAIPIVTILGLSVGQMLAGAVLTETVFSYPGVGRVLVNSIFSRDYSVIQGAILFIAVVFVGVNLIVDLLYGLMDPRIRY